MANKLIDKVLAKIGEKMCKQVLKDYKTISVAHGQYYYGASVTLEPYTEYLILANTATEGGENMTTLVNLQFTGTPADSIGAQARTTSGSGSGVACWFYVKTGADSVTATATMYGYYANTHNEYSKIVAIPLTLITPATT